MHNFSYVKLYIREETLKEIVVANIDDPLLYDGYILTEAQLDRLNELINEKIAPDFQTFEYCLECYGIYES
jgi:hypothetical protein